MKGFSTATIACVSCLTCHCRLQNIQEAGLKMPFADNEIALYLRREVQSSMCLQHYVLFAHPKSLPFPDHMPLFIAFRARDEEIPNSCVNGNKGATHQPDFDS